LVDQSASRNPLTRGVIGLRICRQSGQESSDKNEGMSAVKIFIMVLWALGSTAFAGDNNLVQGKVISVFVTGDSSAANIIVQSSGISGSGVRSLHLPVDASHASLFQALVTSAAAGSLVTLTVDSTDAIWPVIVNAGIRFEPKSP
jgi:hypothetical protein